MERLSSEKERSRIWYSNWFWGFWIV